MRCTRAAVDNQTFKGCGHGCENTNENRKKRSNRVWEVEKPVREGMLTLTESPGIWQNHNQTSPYR